MPVQFATKKRSRRWLFLLFLLFAAIALGGMWWVSVGRMWLEVRETRNHLLHEVDPAATLAACRELMNELPGEQLASDDPRLPAELAALEPMHVTIEKDHVQIECGGGFHHQGFLAFAEDSAANPSGEGVRTQLLVEGLWFYEDSR